MMEIGEAKVSQCREFHDVLKNAPPKAVFVESTYDDFWGSGHNIAGTKQTNKTAWTRKNILGDIITTPPQKIAWVTPRAPDANKKLRQCRKNRASQEDDGSSSDSEFINVNK